MSGRKAQSKPAPSEPALSPGMRSLLLVALLAVLPYLLLPPNPFFFDALNITWRNDVMEKGTLADIWTSDFWGLPMDAEYASRSYRPLVGTTYFLTARVFGYESRAFHIPDMLLHALASVLVALLMASLLPGTRWSVPLAILYAVHPVLCEAVASFVGRADIMASIAIMGGLLLHLRAGSSKRPWLMESGVLLLVATAMLCKEYAVAAPFILLSIDGARIFAGKVDREQRSRILWTCAGAFVLLALYLGLRYTMTGALGGVPMLGAGDMPLYGKSLGVRWGTASWLLVFSVRLILLPINLNYFYNQGTLELVDGLFTLKALAGMILVALWIGFAIHAARKFRALAPLAGAALFFLPLGPTLNTVSYSGVLFGERFLYMPLAGFLLTVGFLLDRTVRTRATTRLVLVAIGICATVFGVATASRVHLWSSEELLVDHALKGYPRSMAGNTHKGRILFGRDNPNRDPEKAAMYFERALEVEQRNPGVWTSYGNALMELGRFDEAAVARRRALDISDGTVGALWMWLGEAEFRAGNAEEAVTAFRRTRALEPENQLVQTYLGNSLLRLAQSRVLTGDKQEAIELANEAIDTGSLPGEGVFLAAQIVSRAGQKARAAELYSAALELDSEILRKRHQAAVAAEQNGEHLKAASLFREIVDAQPGHVPTLFNLGRSLVLGGRPADAIGPLSRGLKLKDDPAARNWLRRARSEAQ